MSLTPSSPWRDLPNAPAAGAILARWDELADGGAHLTSLGLEPPLFNVILLRSGKEVFAYVNRCMHFGVPLALKTEYLGVKPHISIRCSVHYARYRWRDGFCEAGDCERESLMAIPVTVRDGNVVIAGA